MFKTILIFLLSLCFSYTSNAQDTTAFFDYQGFTDKTPIVAHHDTTKQIIYIAGFEENQVKVIVFDKVQKKQHNYSFDIEFSFDVSLPLNSFFTDSSFVINFFSDGSNALFKKIEFLFNTNEFFVKDVSDEKLEKSKSIFTKQIDNERALLFRNGRKDNELVVCLFNRSSITQQSLFNKDKMIEQSKLSKSDFKEYFIEAPLDLVYENDRNYNNNSLTRKCYFYNDTLQIIAHDRKENVHSLILSLKDNSFKYLNIPYKGPIKAVLQRRVVNCIYKNYLVTADFSEEKVVLTFFDKVYGNKIKEINIDDKVDKSILGLHELVYRNNTYEPLKSLKKGLLGYATLNHRFLQTEELDSAKFKIQFGSYNIKGENLAGILRAASSMVMFVAPYVYPFGSVPLVTSGNYVLFYNYYAASLAVASRLFMDNINIAKTRITTLKLNKSTFELAPSNFTIEYKNLAETVIDEKLLAIVFFGNSSKKFVLKHFKNNNIKSILIESF